MSADESPSDPAPPIAAPSSETTRRGFLRTTSTVAMAGGLVAGYGTFFAMAGRFLYPAAAQLTGWQFVAETGDLRIGDAVNFVTPAGAKIVVARQDDGDDAASFIALSSVCPHLGCQVHWEPQNDRFFCPCHNGAFDPQGRPTEGPPAAAGQQLARYPLRVDSGLLFIEIPLETISIQQASRDAVADPRGGEGRSTWA